MILADGTYGQQVVEEQEEEQGQDCFLKKDMIENPFTCNQVATCLFKMMYKIKEQKTLFNRLAADTILIFCNMIRLLSSKNTQKNNQSQIEKISMYIKLLMKPDDLH